MIDVSYVILIVHIQCLSTEYLPENSKEFTDRFLVYKNVQTPKTGIRPFIYNFLIKHCFIHPMSYAH